MNKMIIHISLIHEQNEYPFSASLIHEQIEHPLSVIHKPSEY